MKYSKILNEKTNYQLNITPYHIYLHINLTLPLIYIYI